MELEFARDDLDRLETDVAFEMGLPRSVVRAYRKRVQFIRAAQDERDLRAWKSLHLEKLKGARQHQYSIRLNEQFRLILEFVGDGPDKRLRIVGIEDYHP